MPARATLTVTSSTFTSNTAGSDGGAIDNADGTPGGRAAPRPSPARPSPPTRPTSDGGAIDSADAGSGNLTVTGSTFTANSAGHRRWRPSTTPTPAGGTATVASSTAHRRTRPATTVAAIDNGDDQPTGTDRAWPSRSSTLTSNTATQFDGGAIDNGDGARRAVTASVTGSTFARDQAGADGGAIDNGDGATVARAA